MTWKVHRLPARITPAGYLSRLRHLPHAFLLESSASAGQRFDLLGAAPGTVVQSLDGRSEVIDRTGTRAIADPFAEIARLVGTRAPASRCPVDIDFCGGAVGYFGYELAYGLEALGPCGPRQGSMPDLCVGIYDWFIVRDRRDDETLLIATPAVDDEVFAQLVSLCEGKDPSAGCSEGGAADVASSLPWPAYQDAIRRILAYINAGDCYQVNLAQRFEAIIDIDPVALYERISARQCAPFAACLLNPAGNILSFSPERFLRVERGNVLTQPIKGTRPRGVTPQEDESLAQMLVASEKDRAENLMIVDLLRNDLGRSCVTGSVEVQRLFELQSFPNVHHLVSTVTGRLADGITPMDLLRNCFPGGSITGAPKVRAMQIIAELEPVRREAYCGAIGYLSYAGDMDTNLSIRTLVHSDGRVRYWGGGGIVADSTARDEYEESLAKVDFIREALLPPRRSMRATRHTR